MRTAHSRSAKVGVSETHRNSQEHHAGTLRNRSAHPVRPDTSPERAAGCV